MATTTKPPLQLAQNDSASTNEDTAININVLANDLSPGGMVKSLYSLAQSGTTVATTAATQLGATVTMNSDGTVHYDPTHAAAIQALAQGAAATDTFTYTMKEATSSGGNSTLSTAKVTVGLTGVNDPAVIGDPTNTSVTEDHNVDASGNLTASGTIPVSDVDTGQSSFKTAVAAASGDLGSLSLAANGSYTYTVANSAVQYLNTGQTKIDTFTVTALDGTPKQVAFTINGVDEPHPVSLAYVSGYRLIDTDGDGGWNTGQSDTAEISFVSNLTGGPPGSTLSGYYDGRGFTGFAVNGANGHLTSASLHVSADALFGEPSTFGIYALAGSDPRSDFLVLGPYASFNDGALVGSGSVDSNSLGDRSFALNTTAIQAILDSGAPYIELRIQDDDGPGANSEGVYFNYTASWDATINLIFG